MVKKLQELYVVNQTFPNLEFLVSVDKSRHIYIRATSDTLKEFPQMYKYKKRCTIENLFNLLFISQDKRAFYFDMMKERKTKHDSNYHFDVLSLVL